MPLEELFDELPSDWDYITLGEACSRGGGGVQTGPFGSQLHAADYVAEGIPSIMPLNIGENRVIEDGIARITAKDAARLNRYLVQKGDIVYSRRGDVERRALIREHEDGWLCGTGCLRVRLGENGANPTYASYYLGHPSVREWIVRHAQGATMPNLNTSILSALPFVFPPPNEQRAIASVLGALDDKIELNRRMNETLEALAQTLFKSWFVDATQSALPKGWREGKLRDCCERVENGGTPKRDEPSYWTPATIPWLTSGEVRQAIVTKTENCISEEGLANSSAKLWPVGTTVVALYGATAGQVCFLAESMCSNQACCGLIPKKEMRYYVYLHASSSVAALEQQARGSAQQNLSQQIVADFPATIPDDDTLSEFDQIVYPLFARWISNLNESRTLAALRDALLPKLLSGALRLPAPMLRQAGVPATAKLTEATA